VLNYYYLLNGAWAKDDKSFSASKVNSTIYVIFEPQRKHSAVFYHGADDKTHYYFVTDGKWNHDQNSFLAFFGSEKRYKKNLEGKTPKKVIIVSKKIVNILV
jgi:leucyl-tRNA synthetase